MLSSNERKTMKMNVMMITRILHGKQPPPNYFGGPNCIKRGNKMFLLTPTSHYTKEKRGGRWKTVNPVL